MHPRSSCFFSFGNGPSGVGFLCYTRKRPRLFVFFGRGCVLGGGGLLVFWIFFVFPNVYPLHVILVLLI